MLWCADITYLETWQDRCYLAAIQDLYSRRIVGWQLAAHMRAQLVVDALQIAVHHRRPRPGLVHHSDQGSQFVSLAFGQAARDAGIAVSMGSRGDCVDDAVAESFFSTLKKKADPTRRPVSNTRGSASGGVRLHRGVLYNRTHRHSALGYLSPAQFEAMTMINNNQDND